MATATAPVTFVNNPGATISPDTYTDVDYAEKLRLWEEVREDARFPDYLYGCYECGICVAACPSARFYDFSVAVWPMVCRLVSS